ncbi:MAG: putative DNA binding domain-containing protein, partial [Candidatus Thorarchaeota archaeon]|nr:putative DNA binding domain-containing protein [Candidatus Thorarchaeota archaeon]
MDKIPTTESQPNPLDIIIINYLMGQRGEMPWLDFKEILHIERGSDFPEITKDIFAMANYGGGYIVFGVREKDTGSFEFIGLPSDFHVDGATVTEKFNSYSSQPISLLWVEHSEIIRDTPLKFAIMYIPPSKTVLVPIKEGAYGRGHQRKIVFKANDVFIRRGSQSIKASSNEIEWIAARAKDERHNLSILSGEADEVRETLFGNLLEVKKLPDHVYIGEVLPRRTKGSQRFPGPYVIFDHKCYSFLNLSRPSFKSIVKQDTILRIRTGDLDEEDLQIIVLLLNNEIKTACYSIGLKYQSRGRKYYFPLRPRDGSRRRIKWSGRYRASTRTVAQKIIPEVGGNLEYCSHAAVKLVAREIDSSLYIQISPRIVLTSDGYKPIIDSTMGTKITSLSYNEYNGQYLLNILFWISLFPTDNGDIIINDRIRLSGEPVRSITEVGIRGDLPKKEQQDEFEDHYISIEDQTIETFPSRYLGEPTLRFGGGGTEKDPRVGLKHFGPYVPHDGGSPLSQIRLGIVGTGRTIRLAKDIVSLLKSPIGSAKRNQWLFPPYPGFKLDSAIGCDIVTQSNWIATISNTRIRRIVDIDDVNERIAQAAILFAEHVGKVVSEDSPPAVVLCCLPKEIEEYCGISERTRGAKQKRLSPEEKKLLKLKEEGQTFLTEWGIGIDLMKPNRASEKNYDLWAALKGRAMDLGVPIQLLQESTGRDILHYSPKTSSTEPPASFAWNLSTALYYKASGRPWRLAELSEGTCYVGISFYRSRVSSDSFLRTSMAQIFTHSGEGYVLRGGSVKVRETTKEAHLERHQAKELMDEIIRKFTERTNAPPNRVVVHKTSFFSEEELSGFQEAIGDTPADYVAIREKQGYRFLRSGNYPILRGMMISLSPSVHLLYTHGYSPRLRSYPGHHVPDPLYIHHN